MENTMTAANQAPFLFSLEKNRPEKALTGKGFFRAPHNYAYIHAHARFLFG